MEKDLVKKEFIAEQVNWISKPSSTAKVKIRYGFLHKEKQAEIFPIKNKVRVIFKTKQRAITPGQSAVFYKGKELLGGGIIT